METVTQAVDTLRAAGLRGSRALNRSEAAALAAIYCSYSPILTSAVRRILGSQADAEDVVHDVFSGLPRTIALYRTGAFGGWLGRVATRVALMRMRTARRRREELCSDPAIFGAQTGNSEGELCSALDFEVLRKMVTELPESLSRVTALRFFSGLTHDEIARELSISTTASEVRLCRALKQLRRMMPDRTSDARRIA